MNKENFKTIFIPTIISAILIMIINNFHIDSYYKYFIIPIIILIITYLYILNKNNLLINKKGYHYLIPISLILLATIILNTDISNKVLNIFIIPILISMLFLSLTNKNYQVSGTFLKWFYKLFPKDTFDNLKYLKENIAIKNNKKKQITSIITGILISIPFVVIILALLTSADMYFNKFIEKVTNNIDLLINFNFIKNNLLIFIISFIILFSVIINIIKNKNSKESKIEKRKVEITTANTILIMINLVFVLFIISEISKITVNFLALPTEYTYASYAREGFFQLLAVTVINFSIILYYLYKTDAVKQNKLLKNLIFLLIAFTIILIFNSYYRMFLYMNEFGFTILRTQVILFLTMELILSITIIKKILTNLKHRDATIFTNVILSTYIINIFICNIDLMNYLNRLINK